MKTKFDQVYQFKITLRGAKPPIWRRIQVPETYTFYDLHVAIQDAMGWDDYHMHEFELVNPSTGQNIWIGIPDEIFGYDSGREILAGWKQKISQWLSLENKSAEYTYDFGDNWEHIIKLEKILPRKDSVKYPVCTAGKLACPPEDCGGIWGYADFLEIIGDPDNEEYEEMMEWAGDEFDPEHFSPNEVIFTDPAKRLKTALQR